MSDIFLIFNPNQFIIFSTEKQSASDYTQKIPGTTKKLLCDCSQFLEALFKSVKFLKNKAVVSPPNWFLQCIQS